VPILEFLAAHLRLRLTWDQCSEMAFHLRFAHHFRDGIYFAHPASPWQRQQRKQQWPSAAILSERGSPVSIRRRGAARR
jgi:hypothetical protein